jgi:hypothetical protein
MQLPTWVILGLREPLPASEFVSRARALGVPAEETRDGISLPAGFLCRVVPSPLPERLCDCALLNGPLELGPAQLHISGGTNELERGQHAQPEELRRAAREAVERMRGPGDPHATIESNASRKVRSLLDSLVRLAPLASAVVLPHANHTAFDMGAFLERARPYLEEGGYPFPLFSFLKVREDADIPTLESVGMWIFGLPDVAMALPDGLETHTAARCLGEVQREMVAEGRWFETDARFVTEALGEVVLVRRRDGLWVAPSRFTTTPAIASAASRFARRRALAQILGPHTHHHMPALADGVAIEHYLRADQSGLAISNGFADRPQAGGTPDDENLHVEIVLTSPELGPWANGWLRWIIGAMRAGDGSRPIRPNDRMVLGDATIPIAGAVLCPMGYIGAEPPAASHHPGAPQAELWDMLPFSHEELASFRASPGAQGDWLDAYITQGRVPELQARWRPPAR